VVKAATVGKADGANVGVGGGRVGFCVGCRVGCRVGWDEGVVGLDEG
jgi:hypothetical protein